MSKAFFREDTVPEDEVTPQPVTILPPGVKNLMTAAGARALRTKVQSLLDARVPVAGDADPEARRRLALLDQQIRRGQDSLRTAEVVEAPVENPGVVRFGATVQVRDARGELSLYQLVGVDETAPEQGRISWRSPLAEALMNARVGQVIQLKTPRGVSELTVVEIRYE